MATAALGSGRFGACVTARALGALAAVAVGVATLPLSLTGVDARTVAMALVRDELAHDARAAFAERDRNADGLVTPAEVPYLRPATFERLDADGDGRISAAEGMPAPAILAEAASRAEATLHAAFAQIDADGDGRVSAAEGPAFAGATYEGFVRGMQARHQASPAAAAAAAGRAPVLMLPGFLMPSSSFALMRETLMKAGYRDFKVLNRWPWFTAIDEYAAEGKLLADRLRRRTGAARIELLGHSMGGLVGRTMIQDLGYEPHVSHYVSFGTPHHGTAIGSLAQWYAHSAWQMLPGSPYLRALNAREGQPSPIRYTSVHAQFDEIVYPPSSVYLAGAANPMVPFVFHTTMVMMPSVCEATLAALAAP